MPVTIPIVKTTVSSSTCRQFRGGGVSKIILVIINGLAWHVRYTVLLCHIIAQDSSVQSKHKLFIFRSFVFFFWIWTNFTLISPLNYAQPEPICNNYFYSLISSTNPSFHLLSVKSSLSLLNLFMNVNVCPGGHPIYSQVS